MASFARKIKRKQFVAARKKFIKDFKTSMRSFRKQVVCSKCGRPPHEGENIDDWHIDKYSDNIDHCSYGGGRPKGAKCLIQVVPTTW